MNSINFEKNVMIYKKNWVKIKVQNIQKKNAYLSQEIRYNASSLHKFDGYVDIC